MATKEEIDKERIEISDLIRATPKDAEEKVRNYHSEIVKRLDNGVIITVPSLDHRNLHQEMWIVSFMIYNNYDNQQKAFVDFLNKPIRWPEGQVEPERLRFDIFYEKNYIQPYLAKTSKQYKWASRVDETTQKEVDSIFHKSLNDVTVEI